MSTTTNGCPYFTGLFAGVQSSIGGTMKIKSISAFCFLFVFVAILNPGSANATILTSLSGTEVRITNNVFEALGTEVQCGDGSSLYFNYVQRVVINGKVEMALTEFIRDVGTYETTLLGQCDSRNWYGLGTCACRSEALTDIVFIKDIEPVRWPSL